MTPLPPELDRLRLVDEDTAVQLTGLARQSLRNRRFEGQPPAYHKIGKAVRYRLGDLLDFTDSCRISPRREDSPSHRKQGT